MSETDAATTEATADTTETFIYPVTIEDVGPATKKVTIDIPRQRIDTKLDEQFEELGHAARVPGFRIGRVPPRLLRKRFNNDVKKQVCSDLIQESYQQAIEDNKLTPVSDPEFDNVETIELPDEGSLQYSFQVEVQPDIDLPELSNLEVKKPKVAVTETNMEAAMTNLREQNGALTPVEDRGVQSGDYLIADVHVKLGDEVVLHQHEAQLVARGGRLAGVQIDDLDKQLEGMKPDEVRNLQVHFPDSHPNEKLRGQDAQIEIKLHDIKQMQLADIDQAFLEDLGFESEQELRDALRQQMELRVEADVKRAMYDQLRRYLLDNTQLDLPQKLSQKQSERLASRRKTDLLLRGMPQADIDQAEAEIHSAAREKTVHDLKLFFILNKIAADRKIDVSEAELNGQIAQIAAQHGQRPERVRQEMGKNGSLADLYLHLRELKTLESILEAAKIEEVEPDQMPEQQPQVEEKAG